MSRLTTLQAIALLLFAGCSGQRATSAPATSEAEEGAATEAEEPADSESAEGEAADEAEGAAEEGAAEASEPPAKEPEKEAPRKACDQLDKGTCEVTVGCAWSTTKKCIEQK